MFKEFDKIFYIDTHSNVVKTGFFIAEVSDGYIVSPSISFPHNEASLYYKVDKHEVSDVPFAVSNIEESESKDSILTKFNQVLDLLLEIVNDIEKY